MKLVGHRGAAGLALENTIESIKRAKALAVDGIEFDVRLTKDRQFVLCHDSNLSRVSDSNAEVKDHTLRELKKIKLHNGESVPTLAEALEVTGSTWTIIEVKESGCAKELLEILDQFPGANITVASFKHELATELEELRPELSVYLAERFRPIEIFHLVRTARANGIDLNAWLLNPFTYFLARRHKLEIMAYTVNYRVVSWFIGWLYPSVSICTDYPDRLLTNRSETAKDTAWTTRK